MDIKKEITFTAVSKTEDGTPIITFNGRINSNNPNDISYTSGVMNQRLYRENREKIESDRRAFEDALYREQDEMITESEQKGANEDVNEAE